MDAETFNAIIRGIGNIKITCRYCREDSEFRKIYDSMLDHFASEITITFKQKFRDAMDNDEIETVLAEFFCDMLTHNKLDRLILIREYGDSHNLHYHGLINLRGNGNADLSSLKSFLCKKFGRTTIKAVNKSHRYLNYLIGSKAEIQNKMYYDEELIHQVGCKPEIEYLYFCSSRCVYLE